MHTRLAERDDLERIVEIYNQAVASGYSTGDRESLDSEMQVPWFEAHLPNKYPIFVAEVNDSVVAYNALSSYRNGRQAFRYTLESSYYVDFSYHRRGIASLLMEKVLEFCVQARTKNLLTFVMAQNKASIEFLQKQGFVQWGLLPGIADFDGVEYDHLIYGRRLAI